MNELNQWWPIAERAALRQAPLARVVCGIPVVIFRDAAGVAAALLDRCPHRHVPLSAGKIRGDHLVCCYHGWRFNRAGVCSHVPGVEGLETPSEPIVAAFAVCEVDRLIWLLPEARGTEGEPTPRLERDADHFVFTGAVRSTIDQAAENFLDASHTHFVHSGLLRREGARQKVNVKIRLIPGGVEAEYANEAPQSGLVSRLFESDRANSFGRFRLPGTAEVEYHGSRGMTLRVTAYLTPTSPGVLGVHAVVSTAHGWLPAGIKRFILRRIFSRIFEQDRGVLELQQANRIRHEAAEFLDSPMDLLGPLIRKLRSGATLDAGDERERELLL